MEKNLIACFWFLVCLAENPSLSTHLAMEAEAKVFFLQGGVNNWKDWGWRWRRVKILQSSICSSGGGRAEYTELALLNLIPTLFKMFHFWTIVVNPLYAEGPIIIERLDQTTPFTIHWLLTDCYKIVSQNIWTRKFQIIFFWVLSCSWVEIALKRTRSGRCRCCDVGARHCPTSPTSSGPPPLPGRSGKQGSRHRLELAKNLPLKIFLFPH